MYATTSLVKNIPKVCQRIQRKFSLAIPLPEKILRQKIYQIKDKYLPTTNILNTNFNSEISINNKRVKLTRNSLQIRLKR